MADPVFTNKNPGGEVVSDPGDQFKCLAFNQ